MSYFIVPKPLAGVGEIEISGEEAKHIILSRRFRLGERIILQGTDYVRVSGVVSSIGRRSLSVKITGIVEPPKEPELAITLFQAMVSEAALDYILQKSTELGVVKIVLFNAQNTPAHLLGKVEKKLLRWQRIVLESAKQCDRLKIPEIEFYDWIGKCIREIKNNNIVFLLEKTSRNNIMDYKNGKYKRIGICTGPEGGFTLDEIKNMTEISTVKAVRFGPRILRADTASISATSLAQALFGDLR